MLSLPQMKEEKYIGDTASMTLHMSDFHKK
ncbi:hypothetical protein N786_03510 [Bacillus amyloliquefaciens UASWS BA1]|nr:hypothetical protein N786_03510 [Bacillus amyloliquefaciens UASWS BA1]